MAACLIASNANIPMKITEDSIPQSGTAEQGIAEEEARKKGMEAKSKEFVEKGARRFTRRRDVDKPPLRLRQNHFNPPRCSCIRENIFGDRNPVCSCVGMENYQG